MSHVLFHRPKTLQEPQTPSFMKLCFIKWNTKWNKKRDCDYMWPAEGVTLSFRLIGVSFFGDIWFTSWRSKSIHHEDIWGKLVQAVSEQKQMRNLHGTFGESYVVSVTGEVGEQTRGSVVWNAWPLRGPRLLCGGFKSFQRVLLIPDWNGEHIPSV